MAKAEVDFKLVPEEDGVDDAGPEGAPAGAIANKDKHVEVTAGPAVGETVIGESDEDPSICPLSCPPELSPSSEETGPVPLPPAGR